MGGHHRDPRGTTPRLWRAAISRRVIAGVAAVLAMLAAGFGKVPAAAWLGSRISAPRPISTEPFYVPGWPTLDKWKVFDAFPQRMPLLGSYGEGDPRVMDWQIKRAVELEHAPHDGYVRRAAPHARG